MWSLARRGWYIRALVLALLTGALWLTSAAGIAQAHPVLLRSTPSDGQTVQSAPAQVDLWFSEPAASTGIELALFDRDGKPVPVGPAQLLDRGIHIVVTGLPALPRSVYELRWSVVSKYDLHRLRGTLVFGVGLPATSAGESARPVTGPAATGADALLGWLDLAGTAALCGWLLVDLGLNRRRGRSRAVPVGPAAATVLRLVITLGVLSAVTSVVRSAQQWSSLDAPGSGWGLLAGTGQLTRWSLREAALVGVLVLLIRRARSGGARTWLGGDAALVVLLLCDVALRSASSHAQSGPLSLLVLTAHQSAALTWVGGLGVLAVLSSQLRDQSGELRRLWTGFGLPAAVCVAVLAVTGLLLAGRQVASLDAALGTTYGKALLLKLALVTAALAFGLVHARRLHPWLTRRTDREPAAPQSRGQVIGPLLGAGVLLVAVVMAAIPPAQGPQFTPRTAIAGQITHEVDDLLVTVALRPNQPGHSLLMVDVVSQRRPVPGPVVAVTADLGATTAITLRPAQTIAQGNGRWQAAVDVEATGVMPLQVRINRSGMAPTTLADSWTVPSGLAARPVLVSDRPLAPWTAAAAGAATVLALLAAVALVRRRRNRTRTVEPGPLTPVRELEDSAVHS